MDGVDEDKHLKRELAAVRLRYFLILVCRIQIGTIWPTAQLEFIKEVYI